MLYPQTIDRNRDTIFNFEKPVLHIPWKKLHLAQLGQGGRKYSCQLFTLFLISKLFQGHLAPQSTLNEHQNCPSSCLAIRLSSIPQGSL